MKTMFALVMVGVLVLAGPVQGARASEVCTGVSVSCVRATDLSYRDRVNLVTVATTSEAAARQRADQAYTARYTAMADDYIASEAAARQRANQAYTARYTAMAADYLASEAAALERSSQAYAASHTAMAADYYAARAVALERAGEIDAARYTGMAADYFANLAGEIMARPR